MDLLKFIKLVRDNRIPLFGGHDCKGHGVGHGRMYLSLTFYVKRVNKNLVVSNGAY